MIGGVFQTAKWLIECEIAYYIECCPIEPCNHVLRSPDGIFTEPLHEEIYILRDDRLLFPDGPIRETGIQESSLTMVIGLGGLAENTMLSVRGLSIN